MGTNTKIAWADHTINFWMGCEPVSEGCVNCYARGFWKRMGLEPGARRRVSEKTIQATLRKAKPGDKVFVNSLSDFFDPQVSDEWRDEAMGHMSTNPWFTFLLLTKRPEKMLSYLHEVRRSLKEHHSKGYRAGADDREDPAWHEKNGSQIWLGVTAENQKRADERIPKLLNIDWPGKKFVSYEPGLGAVDLVSFLPCGCCDRDLQGVALDWVIAGGESGAHRRPLKAEWVRSPRDQCVTAGVPFFFKGWIGNRHDEANRTLDGRTWEGSPDDAST